VKKVSFKGKYLAGSTLARQGGFSAQKNEPFACLSQKCFDPAKHILPIFCVSVNNNLFLVMFHQEIMPKN
jgi:hypothetical protein